jgi:hypothetical protein
MEMEEGMEMTKPKANGQRKPGSWLQGAMDRGRGKHGRKCGWDRRDPQRQGSVINHDPIGFFAQLGRSTVHLFSAEEPAEPASRTAEQNLS